jgi:hypothetical protein
MASRLAVLVLAASPLVGTTVRECSEGITASYDVATTCGPAGAATFSFTGGGQPGCCDGCRAFVDATGAGAVGLPERGEAFAFSDSSSDSPTDAFDDGDFALVGPVLLVGSTPPMTVDRICRVEATGAGTLAVRCEGPAPEADCTGTLARRTAP